MAFLQRQSNSQVLHCVCIAVVVLLVLLDLSPRVAGQVPYMRHLSESRIRELESLSRRLNNSINQEKYACESYYDYVCSHNQPLFSILGHQPEMDDIIDLLIQLQNDGEDFQAKKKLMDFFTSCHMVKSVDDCYREAFEYFKPLFGYIIVKNYIDGATHEHRTFMDLLERFLKKSESTVNFHRIPATYHQITLLREKFRTPDTFFKKYDLDYEYRNLTIYKDNYKYNVRYLQEFRKQNLTYVINLHRTILDWSLYVFQSRNKPMSYYYATLNVHLWMTMYNNTERMREPKQLQQYAECLKLPPFVTALEEARILAVVYLKSFRNAWEDYNQWVVDHRYIYDHENAELYNYSKNQSLVLLNNDRLFFTLYAQNFCEFGKELAENIFYIGLQQSQQFNNVYSCGYRSNSGIECV